jgi:hydroxymethylbilane synthase
MLKKPLRIATRRSPLALWQANFVKEKLEELHNDIQVEIIPLVTQGDRLLSVKLANFGGKGLFIKELEEALLAGKADIAVHSMKDLPTDLPKNFHIGAITERQDPRDVLVSNHYSSLELLPDQAKIGTSSLRRMCQMQRFKNTLVFADLRGNIDTRLRKLDEGEFDAIILAAAGLKRLGLEKRIQVFLDPAFFIPAVGQGALAIECRAEDSVILDRIAPLDHAPTRACVTAERVVNARLGGGCHAPIAAHAFFENDNLILKGMVANFSTQKYLEATATGKNPEHIGLELAEKLLFQGADKLLKESFIC